MSSEPVQAEWLNAIPLKSKAARRFTEFCQQNLAVAAQQENFDLHLYREAVRLVIERLEHAATTGEQE